VHGEFSFLELSQSGVEELEILSAGTLIAMEGQEQKLYVHLDLLGGTRKFWRLLCLRRTNPKRLLVIVVDGVISLPFTL
jgi:hypothetical protein